MWLETYIEEVRHTAEVASLNYEIWWIYKEKNSRSKFINVLNRYPMYFQTSIHAHFVALVIALYRPFETRKDSLNLSMLLKSLLSGYN